MTKRSEFTKKLLGLDKLLDNIGIGNLIQWLNQWNPWALHRKIEYQREDIAELNKRLTACYKREDEQQELILNLESKLRHKDRECDLSHECAKFNLNEKAKAIGLMRSEVFAAMRLLKEVTETEY